MATLQERAIKAAKFYLSENMGMNVKAVIDDFIIAYDGDGLVFCKCGITEDNLPDLECSADERAEFERTAIKYLTECSDIALGPVWMDKIDMVRCGDNNAFLRHAKKYMTL